MTWLCPRCGHDLSADEPVRDGDWLLEVDRAYYRDKVLALTPGEANFLHLLAKGKGRIVRGEVLGKWVRNRAGNPSAVAKVRAHSIHKKLGRVPFIAVPPHGYRWITQEAI